MKALTIKQPWASLIAHGIKDVENRSWKTNYRGKIYIHVSSSVFRPYKHTLTPEQLTQCHINYRKGNLPRTDLLPYSAIIGEVEIIDCVQNHQSIWAEEGAYHWVLANAILYDVPILNVKGRLNFWEFNNKQL